MTISLSVLFFTTFAVKTQISQKNDLKIISWADTIGWYSTRIDQRLNIIGQINIVNMTPQTDYYPSLK